MNLAIAENLACALILVRAFYCLRIPMRSESYTNKGERYEDAPRQV